MAVREVNLIPARVLQQRLVVRHVTVWMYVYAAVAAVIAGACVAYSSVVLTNRRTPVDEAQVRKQLAAAVARIDRNKAELERLAFVRRASSPGSVTGLLTRLADLMDPQVWLSGLSLDVEADDASRKLTMHGYAASNARLGDFIRKLAQDPMFRDVVLNSAVEARGRLDGNEEPQDRIRFTIEATISNP